MTSTRTVGGVLVVLLALLTSAAFGAGPFLASGGSASAPASVSPPLSAVPHAAAPTATLSSVGVAPAVGTSRAALSSSEPCYNLNLTICVSVTNSSVPNIIPAPGSHVSSVEPSATTTINLWIRSETNLIWSANAPTNGPRSPIQLNATGLLWNGVPYYSTSDGTTWHPGGTDWWSYGPANANSTYPYYYGVSFSARSATGTPNFFPGMTLTWWIYFVQNTSGVYTHWSSVPFEFTFGGAWPASPYAGAAQYAGSGAAFEDIAVSQTPLAPNYDDRVNVSISTTSFDLASNATIGGAYLDLTESAPNGAVENSTTFTFPVTVHSFVGQVQANVTIPATLALHPGSLVNYRITAWDTSLWVAGQVGPDAIVTPWFNYTTNGNGTFQSGIFGTDLAVTTDPVGPGLGGGSAPTVPAGTLVHLNLSSRNPTTAIEAAQVSVEVSVPGINETVPLLISLARVNSTNFVGAIPAMPIGAVVHFWVTAWDFSQDREESGAFAYSTPTLPQLLTSVPGNSTFFVVYVYDNGTGQWVSGATVGIAGTQGTGYVSSVSDTLAGVAYANQTGQPFVPLLLSANASYRLTLFDPHFVPAGAAAASSVSVTVRLPHDPARTGVLVDGSDYVVAESGPAIYFWLNQTFSTPTYSPTVAGASGLLTLGAAFGLVGIALAAVPLLAWWRGIRERRVEQERRITL